ncbi:MAG: MarR family transcriptional regulator [Clostridia bacterium]|nr:MarR family transcriptional regulator [Clostridia bacterium]MBP3495326.1 MarR family transcriptional regulator [Clostridia bacterium]MBQ7788226.1 MarR family transcriptional regulator [Clostridia bacterium]
MMEHRLDIERDEVSLLTLVNWFSKVFEEKISSLSPLKIINQKGARFILKTLSIDNGITQNEIVRVTHLKGSTISVALNQMEKEGLVEREDSSTDLRKVRVYITEKGLETKKKIDEIIKTIEKSAFKDVSQKDLHTALYVVSTMINNLHQ